MDMVPEKSDYDYGTNVLPIVSTYIPRIFWPTKPVFGRAQWWAPGSPARNSIATRNSLDPRIGILGAMQLNGGACRHTPRAWPLQPSCSAPPTSTSGSMRTSPGSKFLVGDHLLQRMVHGRW